MTTDDPSGGEEVGIAASVPLELGTVEAVRRPAIALDQEPGADEPEIHFPTLDDRVELDRWEREVLHESGECELEDAVGRFRVDRPVVDGGAQRDDTGPAGSGMFEQCGLDGIESRESCSQRMSEQPVDLVGGDGAEVEQCPQDVRAADLVDALWRQPPEVGRAMNGHSVE